MKEPGRAAQWLSRLALLLLSLLLAELSLRALGLAIPRIHALTGPRRTMTRLIPQPVLGSGGNPEFPEHDERGFRNSSALHRAQIVALGDSQTYGTSGRAEHAWPAVLERKRGTAVYNMGLGGYGAAHNVENLATALGLNPDFVIFALYFGNDFADDFRFALSNGRLSTIISLQAVEKVAGLERESPLADEVRFLFTRGRDGEGGARTGQAGRRLLRWLSEHIRLFGLLREFKERFAGRHESPLLHRDFETARTSLTDRQLSFVSPFDGGEWKTILTAPYRLRVMDDSDPRIRAGIEVTKHMLRRMRKRVVEAGAEYLVLLVPTKEYVFWPKVESPADHPMLEALVETEARLHEELEVFLRSEGIRYVDPSPALRSSVEQPYFANRDGHPNRRGHEIIAREVLRQLTLRP